ncbi:Rv1733c family protein [Streptomyces omiyaensis]|uniref:Integral membrane protein n=1 Tax=Streptomyces omiyaensis TaxID=68247 RepID=A0ABW7BYS1_9ACTN|nr:hypothetical protein [Streptomyces omiyaensis]GGY51311.1 hypothetical protein GCM10010363_35380 [Streptomyces omiyaensis]
MSERDPYGRAPDPSYADPGRRTAVLLVLLAALVCGVLGGAYLWSFATGVDRARAADLHRVTATTTGRAAQPEAALRLGSDPVAVAPAVWEYPDDVRRTGTVEVPPRTPPGGTVAVWVDDAGALVHRTGGNADRLLVTFAGGVATAGAAGAAGAGVVALVRYCADRRTLAALEREWEQVEPVWTGRLRRGSGPPADDA